MCKSNCGCSKAHQLKAHLSRDEIKRASLDGREYLVVPVIMARGDVVMNGLLTPASEFETFAWNGVPSHSGIRLMREAHSSAPMSPRKSRSSQ